MVMKSASAEGSTVSPSFQLLGSEPIPSKGDDPIRHDWGFDELGVAHHDPFWSVAAAPSGVTKMRTTAS